ncbi:hypothetical protein AWRI1631_73830 [Saccharomyces cerevisiae AWRI1631]|uniref:Uncharacterized protein n=1 Tax=Saccharomyces cerevisiae (strain AWRI1631) TaxID=545124 RepID=B5VJA4_YEAS6|nr:hypothetical protein AWRI1631_73830 [Saccharomyces cerevisiae AWRI1631]
MVAVVSEVDTWEPTAQTCHGLVTIITTPFTTSPSKWRPLVVPLLIQFLSKRSHLFQLR